MGIRPYWTFVKMQLVTPNVYLSCTPQEDLHLDCTRAEVLPEALLGLQHAWHTKDSSDHLNGYVNICRQC